MASTVTELAQSALCAVGFCMYLLGPGYLALQAANPFGAKSRSRVEQLLWSVVLSLPLALVLAELLGRVFAPFVITLVFVLITAWAAMLAWRARRSQPSASNDPGARRATRIAAGLLLVFSAYILLALVDVQAGPRLFVPTVLTDWYVRVPMVASAIHGPVPPLNPLSALGGKPAPLRYYYFWYVLCAQPARWLHVPAKPALAASCAWAAVAFVSVLFLSLKYLAGLEKSLRATCLLIFPLLAVIGLDILPALATVIPRHGHPHIDPEWWHNDRTPGFLTTLLNSPHHMGGIVCCFTAFLLLVHITRQRSGAEPDNGSLAANTVLAGIAFAACAGASTFLALIFAGICVLWALDLLRTRQFRQIGALAAMGLVAWLPSRPFLKEMSAGSSAAKGLASFAWRSNAFAASMLAKHPIAPSHPIVGVLARQPLILALDFAELGFFAFVALHRFRGELLPALRGQKQLTAGQRALWIIATGAGIAALFISSAVTQSANDLGMHAGMVVRTVLLLWSVPYLSERWAQRRAARPQRLPARTLNLAAVACLFLGFAGGIFGLAMNRLYFPAVEAGLISKNMDALTADRLSYRLFAIRSAWQQLGNTLPSSARVQFNPTGIMEPAFSLYSNREIPAFDSGCGTAFGGDYAQCQPVSLELHHLFATQAAPFNDRGKLTYPPVDTVATTADFEQACRDLSLGAVMVESTDHAWQQPDSWVWTVSPAFASPTVRVFRCPAS